MSWSALQTRTNIAALAMFGELVTIGFTTGIRATFDEPYAHASVGDAGMASSDPALTLATADVPALPVGKPVVVRGLDYTITAHMPDGFGLSRLVLEKP